MTKYYNNDKVESIERFLKEEPNADPLKRQAAEEQLFHEIFDTVFPWEQQKKPKQKFRKTFNPKTGKPYVKGRFYTKGKTNWKQPLQAKVTYADSFGNSYTVLKRGV